MTYRTVLGDTFDGIAYKVYKDEQKALDIIEANIEYADVLIFGSGINLIIPDVESAPSSNLPPWKKEGV